MKFILALLLFPVLCGQAFGQHVQPVKIRAGGVEFHYLEKGQGEPLILLHGGTGDYRSWESQIKEFSKTYRVISYSRRYHYPNKNQFVGNNHSAYVEADDLAAFLRRVKLKKVHLVGVSYGALTALVFAVKHPKMVHSLVLAEPPAHQLIKDLPDGKDIYENFMTSTWKVAAEEFKKGEDRSAMDVLATGIFGRKLDSLPPANVVAIMKNAPAMKVLALSSEPFPNVSSDKLKRIKHPVLVVTGENTTKIHKLVDKELLRHLPNASEAIIPQAGHGSPRENSPVFNETVLKFLAAAANKQVRQK